MWGGWENSHLFNVLLIIIILNNNKHKYLCFLISVTPADLKMFYKGRRAHYPVLLLGKQRHKIAIPITTN